MKVVLIRVPNKFAVDVLLDKTFAKAEQASQFFQDVMENLVSKGWTRANPVSFCGRKHAFMYRGNKKYVLSLC